MGITPRELDQMTVWEWSHLSHGWSIANENQDGAPKAPSEDRLAELTEKWGA